MKKSTEFSVHAYSATHPNPPEKTIAQQQAEARAGTREENYTMSGGLGERSVEIGSHLEASGKYGDNDTRGIWYNVGVGSTLL